MPRRKPCGDLESLVTGCSLRPVSWDHRSLEGALYGLGRPPDAVPGTPRLDPVHHPPSYGPRFPVVSRQFEVGTVVAHRLTPEDRLILREHYVTGSVRHPYRRRKRIIGTLLLALNEE